jgi:low affinity Fe/Cu permease
MTFARIATWTAAALGTPGAFVLAVLVILLWALAGPIYRFSDTWQLVANTVTTLITFLAVFLIQNTQNRDSAAVHVKLDELIRVGEARNSVMGIETRTDAEIAAARTASQ